VTSLDYLTPAEVARLDLLRPATRAKMIGIADAMTAIGMRVFIGTTMRTVAEQAQAIAAGTTSKGQKLSWHFLGRACDFRRRLPDGSEDLTTGGSEAFWRALQRCAGLFGCRSLAYRKDGAKLLLNGRTWDPGHVEDREGFATLVEAVAAERPDLSIA